MKTKMRSWRVMWDGKGELEGEKIVSCVTYPENLARNRANLLVAAGHTGVEIFETKPGSYERIGE